MSYPVTAGFDNRHGSGTNGKIFVTVQDSDAATGPFEVYITITDPLGAAVHTSAGTGTGEITLADGGIGTFTVDIPLDSEGNYLAGEYIFNVIISDTGTMTSVFNETDTYDYQPNVVPGSSASDDVEFTATYSCTTGEITMVDSTDNTGFSLVGDPGRVVTVQPPAASGESDTVQNLDYEEAIENVAFGFTNAIYTVTLEINRNQQNLTGDIDFVVYELVSKTITLDIQCDSSLCDVAACLETEYDTLETAACGGGGWGNLTPKQRAKWDKAAALATLVQVYRACGNYNKAGEFADELKSFLNCGCGCGSASGDDPVAYTPPA